MFTLVTYAVCGASLALVAYAAIWRRLDFYYAFLNLFRHKRRMLITLTAILIGGVSTFLFGGFVQYIYWGLREQTIHSNLGHIQIYRHGYLESGAANTLAYQIPDAAALKALLTDDPVLGPMIKTVTGQIEFGGSISQYDKETATYFAGVGIEPASAPTFGSLDRIVLGSDLSRFDRDGLLLGVGLAAGLKATYDDPVDLLVVDPHGGENAVSMHVRGLFQSGIKDYDDHLLKMPLLSAQELLNTHGVTKEIILLNDTDQTGAAVDRLTELVDDNKLDLEFRRWEDLAVFYQQVVTNFDGIFFFIKLVMSLLVLFMISNTLMMSVMERTREIGTLRALGVTRGGILVVFLLEGIFLGALGGAASLAIGVGLAELINVRGIPMPASPGYSDGFIAFIRWRDDPALFLFVFGLSLVAAFAASLLPSQRAARLSITDSLRYV